MPDEKFKSAGTKIYEKLQYFSQVLLVEEKIRPKEESKAIYST